MNGLIQSLAIDGESFAVGLLREVHGLGSPPPRAELYDHAQRHGSTDYTTFYQPRFLDIYDGIIAHGDPAQVWATFDALKGKLALGTDHVITFRRTGQLTDERVVGRVATELTGEIVYSTPNMLKWTVSFLCADPRMYNDVTTTARYSPLANDGGVVFPLVFPLSFSAGIAADGGVMKVTNNGNFWTPPTFTVEGPAAAGWSIVNETTGDPIVTTGLALLAGDSCIIDVLNRELTLTGTSRPDLIDAAQTSWFELGAGDTLLRLHGSGFAADVTTLSVTFRDARI